MAFHNDAWQVFDKTGKLVPGKTVTFEEYRDSKTIITGAAHVWIWRVSHGEVEILLQRRAADMQSWPNRFDVSAAGHIDADEAPIVAAVREAYEETGLRIDESDLEFIESRFSEPPILPEIAFVYLYQLRDGMQPKPDHYEVSALEWSRLEDFETMVRTPEDYSFIARPLEYYTKMFEAIRAHVQ